jgi:uroporphyrinogen III methyltransferase/synthase
MNVGTVYLVGAGPGDPKLLTVGGKDALQIADVVVYDRLVHPALLKHAPLSAELVYVGKQADRHTLTQDQINGILAEKALAGKTVVRLKGGDPFVFGRGGEEAEYVRAKGVPFVVLPGVTSAISAPAYAGIPVTHRDTASSFAVITGHERSDSGESSTRTGGEAEERRRWDKIAHAADTLIFLMGVESLTEISTRLIENGRSPSTPVALVRWGTWAGRQETLVGELGTIAESVKLAGFKAPAVTVIGDVVNFRSKLRWWDNRPLSGKRIVVTRAREQASSLIELLSAEGAEPMEFPTIKIVEPADGYTFLDDDLMSLNRFQWIIFTSVNAVKIVFARLKFLGKDARALAGLKVAAIGPSTAEALSSLGIFADFQPEQFISEEVANQFPEDPEGQRFLIPRAKEGTDLLSERLHTLGGMVTLVTAYETVLESDSSAYFLSSFEANEVDVVTFTSSSTVTNFVKALGGDLAKLTNFKIACIGPKTAQTVRDIFLRDPDIVANEYTVPGIVEALRDYFRTNVPPLNEPHTHR